MAEAVVSMYTAGRVSITHAMPELIAEAVFSMSTDGRVGFNHYTHM